MLDQAAAELTQDRMVEAGVGKVEAQEKLPVNAAADSVGSLTIGEALSKLEDGRKCHTHRCLSRLSIVSKQEDKVAILEDRAKHVIHTHIRMALGEDGM